MTSAVESEDGNGDRQCSRSERASERGPLKSCRETEMGWAEVANFCARGEIGRTDLCDAANNGALHSNFLFLRPRSLLPVRQGLVFRPTSWQPLNTSWVFSSYSASEVKFMIIPHNMSKSFASGDIIAY